MSGAMAHGPEGRRTALLVIHGIGQQRPAEVLGNFAQGLIQQRLAAAGPGAARPVFAPRLVDLGDGDPHISLRASGRELGLPCQELDLYEFYWAGMVQGRISAAQAFLWLLRSALAPLDFRRQLPMLLAQRPSAPAGEGREPHPLPILLREVVIALALLLTVLLLLFLGVIAIARLGDLWAALGAFGQAFAAELQLAFAQLAEAAGSATGWSYPGVLLRGLGSFLLRTLAILLFAGVGLVWLYLAGSVLAGLRSAAAIGRRHVRLGIVSPWRGMYAGRPSTWLPWSALALFLLLLAGAALFPLVRRDLAALLQSLAVLQEPALLWWLAFLAFTLLVRRLLATYIGDIALYVSADERSAYHRTRAEIRAAGTERLRRLLTHAGEGGYDAVFVAGHSLGSVIAYDCVNELARDLHAGRELPAHKLHGLITFGSPLDKVFYFFRTEAGEDQAVQAQLLSFLHATKRASSRRDYGPYRLAPYRRFFEGLRWLNVYSPADIVSGYLDFYQLDEQHGRPYANPFSAHNRYWRDPEFYRLVLAWLRREGPGETN